MYLRDTAIILKTEPFREYDSRVTLFGREHGKMIAVARAGRRSDAKSLGHLEPFSEVEVLIAKGSAFDKLAVARVLRPRLALRERLAVLVVAGALTHLIDTLTHPGGREDARLFDLLCDAIDLADACSSEPSLDRSRLLLAAAALKTLDTLGYAPDLGRPSSIVHRSSPNDSRSTMHVLRLLRFARARPLRDLLQITAEATIFREASEAVQEMMKQAPFTAEPHGMKTVAALLG